MRGSEVLLLEGWTGKADLQQLLGAKCHQVPSTSPSQGGNLAILCDISLQSFDLQLAGAETLGCQNSASTLYVLLTVAGGIGVRFLFFLLTGFSADGDLAAAAAFFWLYPALLLRALPRLILHSAPIKK